MNQARNRERDALTPDEVSAKKLRSRIIVTCVLIAPVLLGAYLWWLMPKEGKRGLGTPPPANIPERSGKGGEGVLNREKAPAGE